MNMKLFSTARSKRDATFMALVVWLFALVSGLANACLLETPGNHSNIAAGHASGAHHARAKDTPANEVIAHHDDHDDDSDASKESCLKACDDGSNAPTKLHAGVDPADPGLTVLVSLAWHTLIPVASARGRVDELQAPAVGPPIRLRYARLTL
jgi:hypothetical protein